MPKCEFHPTVDTEVTCTECGRYICPKDMVPTPVGYKCRICARPAKSQYTYVKPRQLIVGGALAAVAGIGGAFLLSFAPGGGYFGLLIGYFWGVLTAEAARRGSGGHRGREMAIVASVAVWVGWILSLLVGGLSPLMPVAATIGAFSTLAWSWNR
jgi:hypothetical protein